MIVQDGFYVGMLTPTLNNVFYFVDIGNPS